MPTKTPIERFAEKIQLDPISNCWNWTAHKNDRGYSQFAFRDGKTSGHRASYMMFKGEIPPHLEVDHMCRNRACVNPNHLRLLTHRENTDFERRKTHCKHGHSFAETGFYVYKSSRPEIGNGKARFCKVCRRIALQNWRASKKAEARLLAPANG